MDYLLSRKVYLLLWCITAPLFLAAQGCGGDGDIRVVDFSKTIPAARQKNRSYDSSCLRVEVAAMVSPKETFVSYHQILDYIGSRLGKDIAFIQRKTYGGIGYFNAPQLKGLDFTGNVFEDVPNPLPGLRVDVIDTQAHHSPAVNPPWTNSADPHFSSNRS